jgi:hypothetical protein
MMLPKEIRRKHLAVTAGFIKFFPRPPKKHFTKRIAKMLPMIGTNSGIEGGRDSASRRPVTTALQSLVVFGFLVM